VCQVHRVLPLSLPQISWIREDRATPLGSTPIMTISSWSYQITSPSAKQSDKGCPDLLSERCVDDDDVDGDNSSVAKNSPVNPCC
jgi:hypothetical protein